MTDEFCNKLVAYHLGLAVSHYLDRGQAFRIYDVAKAIREEFEGDDDGLSAALAFLVTIETAYRKRAIEDGEMQGVDLPVEIPHE